MSARVIARGSGLAADQASAEAASSGQPPSSSGSLAPSHSSLVAPLGPAWPSWSAILAGVAPCTKSTIRFHAAACSSFQIPAQPGVIRPSAVTSVISVSTSPAPPWARAP